MSDVQEDVTLLAHIRAIDEGASAVFDGIRNVAGATGIALVGVFKASADSALKYSESVEKVAFLTGQSTEKASALIAAFRAQGFTTDEATSSMQRLTMRLGAIDTQFRATGKVSAASTQSLKEMGISVKDLEASGGDLTVLLPKIIDHMKNMTDPLERDRLAMQLFGRNFGSIAPLINAGGDAFIKATGDAKLFGVELSSNQVVAFHAWKAAQETSKEALQGITLQLGQAALPALMAVEDAVKSLAAWWQRLTPATQQLAIHVAGLAAVFGTLFGGASSVGNILKTVTSNMGPLGLLLGAVAEPLLMVAAALGLVAGAFLIVRNEWQQSIQIQRAFAPVLAQLHLIFQTLGATVQILQPILQQFFAAFTGGGRASLDGFIASLAGPLLGALKQVQQWILQLNIFLVQHQQQIVAAAGAIRTFAAQFLQFLADVASPFLDFFKVVAGIIKDDLAPALLSIRWPTPDPAFMGVWQWMRQNGRAIGELIFGIAAAFTAWRIALSVYNTYIFITELLTQSWIRAQIMLNASLFANPIGLIVIAIAALVIGLIWAYRNVKPFHDAVDQLFAKLKQFAGWVTGTAVPAVMGFARGVISAVGGLFNWIGTSLHNMVMMAENMWHEFTSRPIYWIVYLVATVIMWWSNLEVSIGKKVIEIISNVAMWFSTLPGKVMTYLTNLVIQIGQWELRMLALAIKTGQEFIASIGNEIAKLPGQVVGFLQGVWNAVHSQSPSIVARGIRMARDFVAGILAALGSLLTSVPRIIASAFGNAAGQAKQALHDAHVPGFAQGAVVGPGFGGPRMAVVGEGNETEVIAKASSLIRAGMQAAQGSGSFGGGGGNITIEYHVDGRLIEKRTSKITGKRVRLQGGGIGSAA